jgi:hypothetical protein
MVATHEASWGPRALGSAGASLGQGKTGFDTLLSAIVAWGPVHLPTH